VDRTVAAALVAVLMEAYRVALKGAKTEVRQVVRMDN
jgi:hypothetical protein